MLNNRKKKDLCSFPIASEHPLGAGQNRVVFQKDSEKVTLRLHKRAHLKKNNNTQQTPQKRKIFNRYRFPFTKTSLLGCLCVRVCVGVMSWNEGWGTARILLSVGTCSNELRRSWHPSARQGSDDGQASGRTREREWEAAIMMQRGEKGRDKKWENRHKFNNKYMDKWWSVELIIGAEKEAEEWRRKN